MKNNSLIQHGNSILRVLENTGSKSLVIDCRKRSMPKWVDTDLLTSYSLCADSLFELEDINDMDLLRRKIAYERFTVISSILPFISDKDKRCNAVAQVATDKGICKQTIGNYLWAYLVYQNISALAPKQNSDNGELTQDEKNMRWALNKYYYTPQKNSLNMVYTLMLKDKYCDTNGELISEYPTFYQFRYFYRQHKKIQNFLISRNGLKSYQRNNRPLLGDGIQAFAPCVGVGMLDATVCDIYLVNDAGGLVGRPILTACIDAFSGMCCGYALSWEGGVYSLRSLMLNVISDKKELCKSFGIEIGIEDWNCNKLPATLVTDKGKEYVSDTFEQIADLGISIVNLPPYRPELKGAVEKFFDIIQGLYKPYLKGKGVIDTDFQERGSHDYRKDACLTMADFEKIILYCIIHYNTKRIIENFPYTDKMLSDKVKPYSNQIWNYGVSQLGANLIETDYNTLVLTLLPRTTGRFSRKGLIVNKMRYKNDGYTEQYLNGGMVTVAYNPDDVSEIWLIEKGRFIPFALIESRFNGKDISVVSDMKAKQKEIVNADRQAGLQAKIDLANHISVIAANAVKNGTTEIKGIRRNRQREQQKSHIDYVKDGVKI